MRSTLLTLLTCCLLPLIGCARGNVELLEAQLRNREAELRSLNGRLQQKEQELAGAQREVRLLQQQLTDKPLPPEATGRLAQIESIEINPQLTGAIDQDGRPGDDVLNVVVAPVDAGGEVVKLDGEIEIEAIDPALPEEERSLGRWEIGIEEAAHKWHDGFIGKGYQLTTPWQRIPRSKELLLLARYTSPDGREFSATRNIPVDPAPEGTPELLPLPQAKNETDSPETGPSPVAAQIEQAGFEEFVKQQETQLARRSAVKAPPLPDTVPVITPRNAPLVELKEPQETAERKSIPLEELLKLPADAETPPFVE